MNSLDLNPALKVVSCTLSSTSSTSKVSRVKRVTYDLRVFCSPYMRVSKWFAGLFGRCPPMKWQRKELPSCSKLLMDNFGSLVNHSLAAPLRVVGKERHSISSGGCWSPRVVLKVLRWSKGSFSPSNCSSCGRRNFEGTRHSRTAMVKVNMPSWPFYLDSGLFSLWSRSSTRPSLFSFLWKGPSSPLLEYLVVFSDYLCHHPGWFLCDCLLVAVVASSLGTVW